MRPQLAFLCQTLPYPPDGGVAIRSYNTLRLLSEHYDVTSICFYRSAVMKDLRASVLALEQLGGELLGLAAVSGECKRLVHKVPRMTAAQPDSARPIKVVQQIFNKLPVE